MDISNRAKTFLLHYAVSNFRIMLNSPTDITVSIFGLQYVHLISCFQYLVIIAFGLRNLTKTYACFNTCIGDPSVLKKITNLIFLLVAYVAE